MFKAVFTAASLFVAGNVAAQEIPKELLTLGLNECKTSCTPAFGEKVCKQLCSCSMNEFKKRLNLPEYLALKSATVQNKITKDQRKVMDGIAKVCDAKLTIDVPKPKVRKPAPKPVPKPGEKKDK